MARLRCDRHLRQDRNNYWEKREESKICGGEGEFEHLMGKGDEGAVECLRKIEEIKKDKGRDRRVYYLVR